MNHIQTVSRRPSFRLLGSGLVLALLAGGCISPQLLKDKENEIVTLREERAGLKKELRLAESEVSALEVALAEASMRTDDVVTPLPQAPIDDFSDLNDLGIETSRRQGNLVINVPAEVTFGSGKAVLTTQGRAALQAVARTLANEYEGHTYWIEGHTDSDPISKAKFDSNRGLSVARALSVLHFLVEDCVIPDSQCVVAGHGEYKPIAPNNGGSKSRNRRVEIVVHPPR
ncbi:MAG: chemotaxis protein MotB [Planctomycetota bacterium]|jgi:chemotaxis protein MotB